MQTPEFDVQAAHRYFSVTCFNQAWELMEKSGRTAAEDEEMIRLSLASLWHWTQRPDCGPKNASVGCWQVSRVYALLGQADNARRYAQLCLAASAGKTTPFFAAYGYEALARAEWIAGNQAQMATYLQQARRLAKEITDEGARKLLETDLQSIGAG